jgi:lipid-A-disaccharide synthase
MTQVLLAVGDVSGDAHAADFVTALRARRPETRFFGLGGELMEKAGVEIVVQQRELAIGGLVELLPSALRVWRTFRLLTAALEASRPDLAVLVDSSGFNLPFAKRLRRAAVPTLYYVAPQIWAWRPGRIRKVARRVDRLAVILPFEPALYARTGIPVEFVGHPLVERLAACAPDRRSARVALGLAPDASVVALLPGSRRNELRHNLGLFLETARALHARAPRLQFVLPVAPSLDGASLGARVRKAALPPSMRLALLEGRSVEALSACDVALAKPGTATLEAALLGRPLVVAARSHALTAALLRKLLRVDFLAMPNLVAGEEVAPEFLQAQAQPQRIAEALLGYLSEPERKRQLARFGELRAKLERGGAARRTAEIAEEMIVAGRAA